MRPIAVFAFALCLLPLLTLQPAQAQMSPGASPRTAAASPLPVTPPAFPAGDADGLCQCLYLGEQTTRTAQAFEKNVLGIKCMSAVEECKSMCQTDSKFSFVPHANFSCRGRAPVDTSATGKIALNTR